MESIILCLSARLALKSLGIKRGDEVITGAPRERIVTARALVAILRDAAELLGCLDALNEMGQSLIGAHYVGLDTDFGSPKAALDAAAETLRILGRRDCPTQLADLIVAGSDQLQDRSWEAAETLRTLLKQLKDHAAEAGFADVREIRPDSSGPIWDVQLGILDKWLTEVCSTLADPLGSMEELYALGQATSVQTVAALEKDVQDAEAITATAAGLIAIEAELEACCGGRYRGDKSDWDELLAGADWATALTDLFREDVGNLPQGVCSKALTAHQGGLSAEDVSRVAASSEDFLDATRSLGQLFTESGPLVSGTLLWERPFEDIDHRLQAMSARLRNLDDWVDLCNIRSALEEDGLVAVLHPTPDGAAETRSAR